jgi:hypothetical protein
MDEICDAVAFLRRTTWNKVNSNDHQDEIIMGKFEITVSIY